MTQQLLLLAFLAGALGSLAGNVARSAGSRRRSERGLALGRAVLAVMQGASYGVIASLVVAGLIISTRCLLCVNPFGIAAISAIAGILARDVTDALRRAFERQMFEK